MCGTLHNLGTRHMAMFGRGIMPVNKIAFLNEEYF